MNSTPTKPFTYKKAFTVIELLMTIVIMVVLVGATYGFISNYLNWAKTSRDQRVLRLTNDAIDRSRATFGTSSHFTGHDATSHDAVLTYLSTVQSDGNIPASKFLVVKNGQGGKYLSWGEGEYFRFYDYNQDGLIIGSFTVH